MADRAQLRIAFQGELGSFSDEAIQQLWGGDVERLPYRDFADVTASVAAGIADRGVLPIENTIVGSIAGTHDAISAIQAVHERRRRKRAWRSSPSCIIVRSPRLDSSASPCA